MNYLDFKLPQVAAHYELFNMGLYNNSEDFLKMLVIDLQEEINSIRDQITTGMIMNYKILIELEESEFEGLRGKSFKGGNVVGVHSKCPTWTTQAGNDFYSVVCFEKYSDYLYYQYKANKEDK